STRQLLNSALASRRTCLEIFILRSDTFELPSRRHLLVGFLHEPLLVFQRQNFPSNLGGRGHHQPAHFPFQFGQHPGVILGCCFPCLGNNLLGGGDGFLRLLFLDFCGGSTGFFDHLCALCAGFIEDFARLVLSIGQIGLDLLGVFQTLGDALAALLEHG